MTRIDGISVDVSLEFEGRWTVKIDPKLPGVEPLMRQILALNEAENLKRAQEFGGPHFGLM